MNDLIKKIDNFLIKKYIFCKIDFLSQLIQDFQILEDSYLEEQIYKEILITKIEDFIDKEKFSNFRLISPNSPTLYEIISFKNIAEPTKQQTETLEDKIDHEYLQAESDEAPKIEKKVFKIVLNNGVDLLNAFEYEPIDGFENILEKPRPKLYILPNAKIKHNIVFLTNKTIKLL